MTLIIKELIIRGKVIKDSTLDETSRFDERWLQDRFREIKKEVEKECVAKVLATLERERKR